MGKIAKGDKQLLTAIGSSALDDDSRRVILDHLDKSSRKKVMKHLRGLVLQNRKAYKLDSNEKSALSKVLAPHKHLLRKHLVDDATDDDDDDDESEVNDLTDSEGGDAKRRKNRRKWKKRRQRGGWVFSTIVSALLPIVSSLIAKSVS